MSFESRLVLSNKMDLHIVDLFSSLGFIVEKSGYENFISDKTKSLVRRIHNDSTVTFIRYLPDLFVHGSDKSFFIELKVMDSPINQQSRVDFLKESSGFDDLTLNNIGAVETSAMNNYAKLTTIGVEILVIVYCTFNDKILLAEWEKNIVKLHSDVVTIGDGNASFTPYTNIHLDKMKSLKELLISDLNVDVKNTKLDKILIDLRVDKVDAQNRIRELLEAKDRERGKLK